MKKILLIVTIFCFCDCLYGQELNLKNVYLYDSSFYNQRFKILEQKLKISNFNTSQAGKCYQKSVAFGLISVLPLLIYEPLMKLTNENTSVGNYSKHQINIPPHVPIIISASLGFISFSYTLQGHSHLKKNEVLNKY